MSGFYLMHRDWQDNAVFGNEEYSSRDAWVWLVENAAWKPTRIRVKGEAIDMERGELCFAQRFMAEKWGWSKSRVDRFLKRLCAENMISIRSKSGATAGQGSGQGQSILTICNYAEYQDVADGQRGNEKPQSGATAGQQRGKEEQGNKGKKEEEESPLPPKGEDRIGQAVSHWNMLASEAGWPQIAKLTDKRNTKLKARLIEHGLDGWISALDRARLAGMLTAPPPSWFTFDFMTVNETNICKVLEGNYDRKISHVGRSAGSPGMGVNEQAMRAAAAQLGLGDRGPRSEDWPADAGASIRRIGPVPSLDRPIWDDGAGPASMAGSGFR